MFDNTNPYTLRTEIRESITHYYVSFSDGQAVQRETEISRPVYLEFSRFMKHERNLRRWDERHSEQSEMTDETLYSRSSRPPKSVEETVLEKQRDERLHQIIAELPEIQHRRFILHYEFGLTYIQIAEMEGCTKMAVKFSIDISTNKIRDKLENF